MSSPEDESSRRYTAMVDCQAELRTVRAERDDLRIQLAEARELLREENRRHQKAAVERDELRAQLATCKIELEAAMETIDEADKDRRRRS